MKAFSKGFTLIELMIVIAILGILYSVALPSYSRYVEDARRAEVQQFLLQQVAILERKYTRLGGYPDLGNFQPASTAYYDFTYEASDLTPLKLNDSFTFELIAKPIGAQKDDRCVNLSINHQGKTMAQTVANADIVGCW